MIIKEMNKAQTQLATSKASVLLSLCYLVGIIMLAVYSGALMSLLAVRKYALPFTTLQGLRQDGAFQFGVLNNTNQQAEFKNSTGGFLRDLYVNHMEMDPDNFPHNYAAAVKRMCSFKYAYLELDVTFMVTMKTAPDACEAVALPEVFSTLNIAMAVAKGSPYKELINYNIQKLRSTGALTLLREHSWTVETETEDGQLFSGVGLQFVVSLLVLLVVTVLLTTLIMLLELFHSLKKKPKQ